MRFTKHYHEQDSAHQHAVTRNNNSANEKAMSGGTGGLDTKQKLAECGTGMETASTNVMTTFKIDEHIFPISVDACYNFQ